MQPIIHQLFKFLFTVVETVTPSLAGRWAIKLFFSPFRHKRPPREQKLIQNAAIQNVPLTGSYDTSVAQPYYVTYSWGKGPAVLLVHGWSGRGSQMASLAQPLADAGYRIITFDAPAHGNSPGRQTNLVEFARIIEDIQARTGQFYAIIGHSLGGIAAGLAAGNGVNAGKIVTIGSPASMDYIFDEFAGQINASPKTIKQLADYVERVTQTDVDNFSLRTIATKLTQPGLIIHDKQDREVDYTQALALAQNWAGSELYLTEKLGHRRILRDPAVISKITDFLAEAQSVSFANVVEVMSDA